MLQITITQNWFGRRLTVIVRGVILSFASPKSIRLNRFKRLPKYVFSEEVFGGQAVVQELTFCVRRNKQKWYKDADNGQSQTC